jgi:hypothetical protein
MSNWRSHCIGFDGHDEPECFTDLDDTIPELRRRIEALAQEPHHRRQRLVLQRHHTLAATMRTHLEVSGDHVVVDVTSQQKLLDALATFHRELIVVCAGIKPPSSS